VYQANDLTHVAYETLLKCTLDVLEDYPAGITLPALIAGVVSLLAEAAEPYASGEDRGIAQEGRDR